MEVREQKTILHMLDGEKQTTTTTHIYSPKGHFERNGNILSWHIELEPVEEPSFYQEVEDGATHEVPDELPNINIYQYRGSE